nr:GNAT family N-acetyltransferase [Candidatus Woesearchaeota archaeon]
MIRLFTSEDEGACKDIAKRCLEETVDLDYKARQYVINKFTKDGYWLLKANTFPLYVYENSSQIVATGGLNINEFKKMYVHPDWQGKGIGTEIINHLKNIAKKNNQQELFLYSWKSSVGFYKRAGFIFVREFIHEEQEIKMPLVEMRSLLLKNNLVV